MMQIQIADLKTQKDDILRLFRAYLEWVHPHFGETMEFVPDIETMWPKFSDMIKFTPPIGTLFVAIEEDDVVGCVCLRHIEEHRGEIKRMYVDPQHRRKGIARALINVVIDEARRLNYNTLYLDSPPFMKGAHQFYASMGFEDVPPYEKNSIPEAWQDKWRFMALHI